MLSVSTEHIAITPGTCGGKPRIAGHRIRVQDVVIWYDRMKMTPDQIIAEFPSITLADVHAALAYYYDHRDAIERQMAEGEAFAAEMMAKAPPSIFQERLRQLRANAADDPVSSG
jgi:uncharacterized protein (DUF433 family)